MQPRRLARTGPAARQRRRRARLRAEAALGRQAVAGPANNAQRTRRPTGPRANPDATYAPTNTGPARTRTSVPAAFALPRRNPNPQMYSMPSGNTRVRHSERIGTVNGSTAFIVRTFQVNPGLRATFPWLSRIAGQYESYKFHSLRFCYRTKSSTIQVGDVILTMDYDALDTPPIDGPIAESYKGAISSTPWQNINFIGAPADLQKLKTHATRSGAVPSGGDRKTYDVGNFYVCTENQAADGDLLGYLYVEYDIELMTPQATTVCASGIATSSSLAGNTVGVLGPLRPTASPAPFIFNQADCAVISDTRFAVHKPSTYYLTLFAVLNDPGAVPTNVYFELTAPVVGPAGTVITIEYNELVDEDPATVSVVHLQAHIAQAAVYAEYEITLSAGELPFATQFTYCAVAELPNGVNPPEPGFGQSPVGQRLGPAAAHRRLRDAERHDVVSIASTATAPEQDVQIPVQNVHPTRSPGAPVRQRLLSAARQH